MNTKRKKKIKDMFKNLFKILNKTAIWILLFFSGILDPGSGSSYSITDLGSRIRILLFLRGSGIPDPDPFIFFEDPGSSDPDPLIF
jgi:hypothetical protein